MEGHNDQYCNTTTLFLMKKKAPFFCNAMFIRDVYSWHFLQNKNVVTLFSSDNCNRELLVIRGSTCILVKSRIGLFIAMS